MIERILLNAAFTIRYVRYNIVMFFVGVKNMVDELINPRVYHCAECECEVPKSFAKRSIFCETCYDKIWSEYYGK